MDEQAKRVYVYEVKLCQEDGTRGSGWSVTVVTDTQDPADLLRIAKVHVASGGTPLGSGPTEKWTGLDEAKLVTVAVLDPRIAV
jgi:hypothetical protein